MILACGVYINPLCLERLLHLGYTSALKSSVKIVGKEYEHK